jgi:hypothetical protein
MDCPTCHRPLPEVGKRICSVCGRKIGRFDKWQFGPDSRPQHRGACPSAPITLDLNPTLQLTLEEGR